MSHFPIIEYVSADTNDARTVDVFKPWSVFAARIDLSAKSFSGGLTSALFTNPILGGSVTVSYSGGSGSIAVGDTVSIGVLVGYYRTGVVTTNPVTLTAYRKGPFPAATILSANSYLLVEPSGGATLVTSSFNVPETYNNSSAPATVAAIGSVPSNSVVCMSSRAGVFRVSAASVGSLTLVKIVDGDVPAGQSIPVGTEISGGFLLGFTKDDTTLDFAGCQWSPHDCWVSAPISPASVTTAPRVQLGWAGSAAAGLGIYGQYIDGDLFPNTATATYVLPSTQYREVSLRTQNGERLAAPRNHPIMFHIGTAPVGLSGPYWVEVIIRGYYSN